MIFYWREGDLGEKRVVEFDSRGMERRMQAGKEGRGCLKCKHIPLVNLAPFLLLAACQTLEMNFAVCAQRQQNNIQ